MPIYAFSCKACGAEIEILCSIHGEYLLHIAPTCECGAKDWERVPTAAAIRFRGDGWQTPRAEGE